MIAAGASYGIDWYRHRFVRSNADLIAFLPGGGGARVFVDVALLRRAGILDSFAKGKLGEDPEYKEFKRQTHFDYRRDLDALGATLEGDRANFLLRGRFDRRELWNYAAARGGTCRTDSCQMPSITPGRWASFALPQPDLLALTAGPRPLDPVARFDFKAGGRYASPSSDPVWIELSQNMLRQPEDLPLPLQILAISVQSADPLILSLGAAGARKPGAFLLKLDAQFSNAAAADTVRKQLGHETKAFSVALGMQRQGPERKDFTELLASGIFQAAGTHVLGHWLVLPELLRALE